MILLIWGSRPNKSSSLQSSQLLCQIHRCYLQLSSWGQSWNKLGTKWHQISEPPCSSQLGLDPDHCPATREPGGTWLPCLLRELLTLDEILLTRPRYCKVWSTEELVVQRHCFKQCSAIENHSSLSRFVGVKHRVMREIPQRLIINDELVFWNSLSVPLDHVILNSCFVFLKQLGVSQESLLQQLQSSFCQDLIVRKFRYWLLQGRPSW